MNEREAIRRYIGQRAGNEIMELSAKVADLADQLESGAEDWGVLEEEALDRRARDLATAHGISYDKALEFAADERPGIVRGNHNGTDRGEADLDRRAMLLMSQEGVDYEEALDRAAEQEDKTIGL